MAEAQHFSGYPLNYLFSSGHHFLQRDSASCRIRFSMSLDLPHIGLLRLYASTTLQAAGPKRYIAGDYGFAPFDWKIMDTLIRHNELGTRYNVYRNHVCPVSWDWMINIIPRWHTTKAASRIVRSWFTTWVLSGAQAGYRGFLQWRVKEAKRSNKAIYDGINNSSWKVASRSEEMQL